MSKNKTNKNTKQTKGTVGAPMKPVKFPVGPFTMARLASMNVKGDYKQCVLSLRNKVADALKSGELVCLKPKKQPKGAVGRPAPVYVLADKYDAATMVVWTPPTKPVRNKTVVPVSETVVPPVSVPVVEVVPIPAPVETVIAEVSSPVIPITTPEVVPTQAPETPIATAAETAPAVVETVVA